MTDLDPFNFARTENANAPAPSLRELHGRWAALKAEECRLTGEVDSMMMKQAGRSWPFVTMEEGCVHDDAQIDGVIDRRPARSAADRTRNEAQRGSYKAALAADRAAFQAVARQLGLVPTVERAAELPRLIDAALDEIYLAPIQTIEDIAAILDVAMGECEIDILSDAIHAPSRIAFTARLLRSLRRLAPGFDFAGLRLDLVPDQFDNLFAEPAGPDRDDEGQVVEIAAEEEPAPAGAAAELSPDETAFLIRWRRLDDTAQADLGCVLRLPPDDREAVLRLLVRALDAKAGQATGNALPGEPPAAA